MRGLLRSVVLSDSRLEVAGTAADGASALRAMETIRPDLVLLDVEMPVMDGLSTLKQMRANGKRLPVIMCSTLTQRGATVTIEALASGAADYVAKPSGQASKEASMRKLAQDLVPKILALTAYATATHDTAPSHSSAFPAAPSQKPAFSAPSPSSTGIWPAHPVPGSVPSIPLPRGMRAHRIRISHRPAHLHRRLCSLEFLPGAPLLSISCFQSCLPTSLCPS